LIRGLDGKWRKDCAFFEQTDKFCDNNLEGISVKIKGKDHLSTKEHGKEIPNSRNLDSEKKSGDEKFNTERNKVSNKGIDDARKPEGKLSVTKNSKKCPIPAKNMGSVSSESIKKIAKKSKS